MSTTRMDLARTLGSGSLLRAILERRTDVLDVFPALPAGPQDVIVRLGGDREPAAPSTVEAIAASMTALGAPDSSLENVALLGEPGTRAVIVGQQPGLLGGPLYSFLKAAGAVQTAMALGLAGGVGGRPWVPVFWNASEDHDLDEINVAVLPGEGGAPRRIRAELAADGRACRDVSSETAIFDAFLDEIEAALPGGPFREGLASVLRETRGGSIAAWFSRLLLDNLGEAGLVIVEPDHVREATRDLMMREVREPGRLTGAVRRGVESVSALGLTPVLSGDREVNLFVFHEGRRRALVRDGEGFRAEGTSARFGAEELLKRIDENPHDFSTNVALRPLVQNAALPVGVQLAGPTEFNYLSELAIAHEDAGVPQPVLLPRPSMTLVEPRVSKALGKLGLTAEDVILDAAGVASAVEGDEVEADLRDRIEGLRTTLETDLGPMLDASGPDGSTGRRKAERLAGHLRRNLEKLERTVVDARREEREVGRRHVERVVNALRPMNRPQERVYGLLPFLAHHGPMLIVDLLKAIGPFMYDHRVVRLGRVEKPWPWMS
jgi:bacillithiol synthase